MKPLFFKLLAITALCGLLLAGCASFYHLAGDASEIASIAFYDGGVLLCEEEDSAAIAEIVAAIEALPLQHYGNPPCYDIGERYILIRYADGRSEQLSASSAVAIKDGQKEWYAWDHFETEPFDAVFERYAGRV